MKAATDLDTLPDITIEPARSRAGDLVELTKMRLNFMVLITTMIGFVIGQAGAIDFWLLVQTLIGTGLCAAGASVLNQAMEWRYDRRMSRTADRPVAAGRMKPAEASLLGLVFCACGLATLWLAVNPVSAGLALATIVLYVAVYTPLKLYTTWNTLIGAIPGAIPPVIGYAGATGRLDLEALGLFAILFCWQMPHFLAIAILLRDDYAAAGYKMMPVVDRTLARTSRWIVAFGLLLIGAGLMPLLVRDTSIGYAIVASLLGAGFLFTGIRCAIIQSRPSARLAFFASIIYLPLALAALMIERLV